MAKPWNKSSNKCWGGDLKPALGNDLRSCPTTCVLLVVSKMLAFELLQTLGVFDVFSSSKGLGLRIPPTSCCFRCLVCPMIVWAFKFLQQVGVLGLFVFFCGVGRWHSLRSMRPWHGIIGKRLWARARMGFVRNWQSKTHYTKHP